MGLEIGFRRSLSRRLLARCTYSLDVSGLGDMCLSKESYMVSFFAHQKVLYARRFWVYRIPAS